MRIIKHVLVLSTILFINVCFGQPGSMIAAKSGVFLRDSASVGSKAIGSIKFGEVINLELGISPVKDVVNGMKGSWWKVKYNSQSGYVFDAYLASIAKYNPSFPRQYPIMFEPNAGCGESNFYNNRFFWYSLVENGNRIKVTAEIINFSVSAENYQDKMQDQYINIELKSGNSSLLLIGLPDSIPNHEFEMSRLHSDQQNFIEQARRYNLYPGQYYYIGNCTQSRKGDYFLEATGHVQKRVIEDSNNSYINPMNRIRDYQINIIEKINGIVRSQNLLDQIGFKGFYESALPTIKFIGDINNDSIPDIILYHVFSHTGAGTFLFMSGYSDQDILTLVASNYFETCF